jgi:hypothetical protein
MPSPLRELAKSKGKTLNALGVASARIIAAGHRRAGPDVIARLAVALGVPEADVQAACDAAWLVKNGAASHATDPTPPAAA